MFKYVSCWPAKEAVGKSSAVAEENFIFKEANIKDDNPMSRYILYLLCGILNT